MPLQISILFTYRNHQILWLYRIIRIKIKIDGMDFRIGQIVYELIILYISEFHELFF